MPELLEKRYPKYKRIQKEFINKLQTGIYSPGEKLPNQQKLAEEYGVSLLTMRQAIKILEDDKIIEGYHGVGTFISNHADIRNIPPAQKTEQVALILAGASPYVNSQYLSETIHVLDRQLRKANQRLVVTSLWSSDMINGRLPPVLSNSNVTGAIIENCVEDSHIEFLQSHNIPVVLLGSHNINVEVPNIIFNQEKAAYLLCEELMSIQKGDVHFIFHQSEYKYLDEIISGYLRACRNGKRKEQLHILPTDYDDFYATEKLTTIIRNSKKPFALFIHADIAHIIERIYRDSGTDIAVCPVVIYGNASRIQPATRRMLNQCKLDVDTGINTSLKVLNKLLAGQAPLLTVIEPVINTHIINGKPDISLSWKCNI